MENEIDVMAILKDKPQGVKLYSSICGAVELKEVLDVRKKKSIVVKELNSSNQHRFWHDGKFFRVGQCVLQPSEKMPYWSKFAWKKGDVLFSEDGVYIIFEEFENDAYTRFKGKHYLWKEYDEEDYSKEETKMLTSKFEKANDNDAQTYINTIEKRLGGKLNRESLEVEKAQPEFKDGDIVRCINGTIVLIKKKSFSQKVYFHAYMVNGKIYFQERNSEYYGHIDDIKRVATEEEKQQLFDAIAKEGKAWDAEKKAIVDLKSKVELKPFDKVLCRDDIGKEWHIDLFESMVTHSSKYNYKCMTNIWKFCIPYEGNGHLLGTTKDVEG